MFLFCFYLFFTNNVSPHTSFSCLNNFSTHSNSSNTPFIQSSWRHLLPSGLQSSLVAYQVCCIAIISLRCSITTLLNWKLCFLNTVFYFFPCLSYLIKFCLSVSSGFHHLLCAWSKQFSKVIFLKYFLKRGLVSSLKMLILSPQCYMYFGI